MATARRAPARPARTAAGSGTHQRRDRQIVRVLTILRLLLQDARLTVYQLAARFRTRRETIYRDLRTLNAVGIPVRGDESGRLSRPQLSPTYQLAVGQVPLTRKEVAAVLSAVKQGGGKHAFAPALATALPKIQLMTAARDGQFAAAFDGAVGGRVRGVKDPTGIEETLVKVVRAIVARQRCEVDYQAPGRSRPRWFQFDPYRILCVHGGYYCVGKVPVYPNPVMLALERIKRLEITNAGFEVDPAIDLKRYEEEAFGVAWERPMTLVVRFRADQAPYVREREWHPTQKLRELPDGRLELSFRAGGAFEIRRWILGWGDAAEVVSPAGLRREVAGALQRASAIYGRAWKN